MPHVNYWLPIVGADAARLSVFLLSTARSAKWGARRSFRRRLHMQRRPATSGGQTWAALVKCSRNDTHCLTTADACKRPKLAHGDPPQITQGSTTIKPDVNS
uniref:Uncharacterized protein n=1 Tax=Zooxanthella nutricula TaxID=1333877 RepID=A0A6U6NDK6_9DINO